MKWKIDRKIRKEKIFRGDLKQLKELFQGKDYYKFLVCFYYNFGFKIDDFATRSLTAKELEELTKIRFELSAGFASIHLVLRKRKGISKMVAHVQRFHPSPSPEESGFYSSFDVSY